MDYKAIKEYNKHITKLKDLKKLKYTFVFFKFSDIRLLINIAETID
jgi:hypothetical protein